MGLVVAAMATLSCHSSRFPCFHVCCVVNNSHCLQQTAQLKIGNNCVQTSSRHNMGLHMQVVLDSSQQAWPQPAPAMSGYSVLAAMLCCPVLLQLCHCLLLPSSCSTDMAISIIVNPYTA
jgi:hypothetical protein